MAFNPDEYDFDEYGDDSIEPFRRRSRVVRWTAILIVASFALAGLSSLSHLW